MRKKIILMACLLLAFAFSAVPSAADENEVWWASAKAEAERDGYGLIDDATLGDRVRSGDAPLILDARADYEFAAGHIPGAVNMEFDLGDRLGLPEAKQQEIRELLGPDTARPVVIYCRSFR
ncbi:hypothetical protein JCM14722_20880 [Pseudodesulfovibrio portus]|uniref:Rhodanese domain-containing protein n=2 Tax=Pseudodesulfovibrio portus TaxID=231439 RepID=A0ABM8ASX9_9BACT|nr:hypothetical protein JCM14722_20880 [Pseudodesulfovibrio portus]